MSIGFSLALHHNVDLFLALIFDLVHDFFVRRKKRGVFCACFAAGLTLDLFLFKSASLTGYELGRVRRRVPVFLFVFHERNSDVLKNLLSNMNCILYGEKMHAL